MERLERVVGRLESLSAESHRCPLDCGEINGINRGRAANVGITVLYVGHSILSPSLSSQEIVLSASPASRLLPLWVTRTLTRHKPSLKETKGKKMSTLNPQKLPISVPVKSIIHAPNIIILPF